MSKVYILTSYGGEYEDKWSHIEGVYADPQKAEEAKARFESEIKAIADIPCPFDDEDKNLTQEQWDAILAWQIKIDTADDFKSCKVKEFEVIE